MYGVDRICENTNFLRNKMNYLGSEAMSFNE